MKRFHVHLRVDDLDASTRFYTRLFGAEPSVARTDYAKWMLDDPRVNFAISARGRGAGIDHLGLQVESDAELDALRGRLRETGLDVADQDDATCCYAESDKGWLEDPQGISWETFVTHAESTTFGEDRDPRDGTSAAPGHAARRAALWQPADARPDAPCCGPGACG